MTWSEMWPELNTAGLDTLYMVWWSTVYAVLAGLPLGVLLVLTDRGGQLQNIVVNKTVGAVVNIGRSLPFIILIVALIPFSRFVVGTSIGPTAAVVALAIGATPFFARLVETAIREVDGGLVEAVQSMGGGTWTIVFKVLLPQALPSLIAGLTTTIITLISYSAMAGAVGGGGLGNLAIVNGYQRSDDRLMLVTVVLLVVVVTIVQFIGDVVVRIIGRRTGTVPAGSSWLRRRGPRKPIAELAPRPAAEVAPGDGPTASARAGTG
ncbi:methionine ABC transporter permease [Streptomyces zagrosensis]|uniref:D-methionine transport system permease protein n=1 Tax=Streptomyces zagrosensis TaxID=1042984 RepID=A0A7W9Q8Q3_9ACTN|nr:methionine ABC transporter permease [Streptomyces zagrosensis]MBB5935674.1 D-methionine transport system permease protein [Streptomyces zagrosensis]